MLIFVHLIRERARDSKVVPDPRYYIRLDIYMYTVVTKLKQNNLRLHSFFEIEMLL